MILIEDGMRSFGKPFNKSTNHLKIPKIHIYPLVIGIPSIYESENITPLCDWFIHED